MVMTNAELDRRQANLDSLSTSIDRLITRCESAEIKAHNAETALMLIRSTTTDDKARAIAAAALDIIGSVR